MAEPRITSSDPYYGLYLAVAQSGRACEARMLAGLTALEQMQSVAVRTDGRRTASLLLAATRDLVGQAATPPTREETRETWRLERAVARLGQDIGAGLNVAAQGNALIAEYRRSLGALSRLAVTIDTGQSAGYASGATPKAVPPMPPSDPAYESLQALGPPGGSMEERVAAGLDALTNAVMLAAKGATGRHSAQTLVNALASILRELGSQPTSPASPASSATVQRILDAFVEEVSSGKWPVSERWSILVARYREWCDATALYLRLGSLKDIQSRSRGGRQGGSSTTVLASPPGSAVTVTQDRVSWVDGAFVQLYAVHDDCQARPPDYRTAARRVWSVYAWLSRLTRIPFGVEESLAAASQTARAQLLIVMANNAPALEAAARGGAPPKSLDVPRTDVENRLHLEVVAAEAVSCELSDAPRYTPTLEHGFRDLEQLYPKPAEVRVFAWLRRHRFLFAAAESNPAQGIDRRAVAGAIAWEALQNVKEALQFVSVGPGKPHVRVPNWGIWKLESVTEEAEEAGYLRSRSWAERAEQARTPPGAIECIIGIMRAGADLTERLTLTSIRRRPDVLTWFYQGFTLAKLREHLLEKLRDHRGGVMSWAVTEGMGAWVREHDLYLRLAVGEPSLPIQTGSPAALLKEIADALLPQFSACNLFVDAIATRYRISTLAALANDQIDMMGAQHPSVSAPEARLLAEEGELVVAGRKKPSHGHVAVVVPGPGEVVDGVFYPNVEGPSINGPTSAAYSDGTKTVLRVWESKAAAGEVQYFRLTSDQGREEARKAEAPQ